MGLLQAVFAIALVVPSSSQHELIKRASGDGAEKRVVCYYTNWSVYRPGTAKYNPLNINPYLCTHLIYAFGSLDKENGLRPHDKYQDIEQGGYAKFTGLKTYNKALKTMIAIGGWNEGSARFSPLVADEERRKEFVKNVVKFLRINHFDGLDLDWEYPAFRDGGKAKDRENYAQLVQELREEFERESEKTGRPRLLLTMAVPAGLEYIDKGYDIPKLNRYLDFMNILSYDYHSAFEPSVNHHSPLYSVVEDSEYNFDSQLTIDATIKHFLMKGADANKLVLGIPTYGRSYTLFNEQATELGSPADGPGEQGDATREKGYLAYYEICENVNKNGWEVVQPKETAMGPYAFKGNQWVGYDDENIVKRKSQYVNEKKLGGIMFWSIDNDDFRGKCHSKPYPLIEAAKEALLGKVVVNNKLPSSSRGGKTNAKSSKLKNQRTQSAVATTVASATITTPEPPTTPDPGSDFVCKEEGFFPHPRDCKKYFWCLDSGPSNLGIVAHQFTCPSGLFFNKAADSCDFARNVLCKKKSGSSSSTTTTSTTTESTTKSSKSNVKATLRTTTTTTTTTTTEPPPPEEEEEEYEEEAEDPQTIKQLIMLIKKLGGVAELEKQLEGNSGGQENTTPAISKSLYERVISKQVNRLPFQRNGPTGPQNEGLPRDNGRSNFRKDKPQYVTIKRDRSTTSSPEASSEIVEEAIEAEFERPKYRPIVRNRASSTDRTSSNDDISERPSERPNRLKYQSAERFRPKVRSTERPAANDEAIENSPRSVVDERAEGAEEDAEEAAVNGGNSDGSDGRRGPAQSSTLRYTNIFRSRSTPSASSTSTGGFESSSTTSRYVTLQRNRQSSPAATDEDPGTTENELVDEEVNTERRPLDASSTTTTTTTRPRILKVSPVLPTTTPASTVRTSTRVVTEIVEGATKRQRVPLNKLHELLNENLIETSTKALVSPVTEPLSVIRTRRPEIIVTTTVRATPLYLIQRRNRLKTTTSTQAPETTTKSRFNRTRYRTSTESADTTENEVRNVRFTPRHKTATESSRFATRSRFSGRRTTTDKVETKKEDEEFFDKDFSRETNVIRRPVSRPRFPTRRNSSRSTTTSTTLNTTPSTTTNSVTVSSVETTVESSTNSTNITEVTTPSQTVTSTLVNSLGSSPTTEIIQEERRFSGRASLERAESVATTTERVNRTRVVLRRKKPVDSDSGNSVVRRNKQEPSGKSLNQNWDEGNSVWDDRASTSSRPSLVRVTSRGKTKFMDSVLKNEGPDVADQITARSRATRTRVVERPSPTASTSTRRPVVSIDEGVMRKRGRNETEEKTKRVLLRGKKKFTGDSETDVSKANATRSDKLRRVVYRKTVKDLAVGESGIPGSDEENEAALEGRPSRGVVKVWDSLLNDDSEFGLVEDEEAQPAEPEPEIQSRPRRPVHRRPISRTSTTTTEVPTTPRQRTTPQILKQRINRFRSERRQSTSTTPATLIDSEPTVRPRRPDFRRVIRPGVQEQALEPIDSSIEQSVAKDTAVAKNAQYLRETSFKPQPQFPQSFREAYEVGDVESSSVSADSGGSSTVRLAPDIVTLRSSSASYEEEMSDIPDLANVAVAAIQSLATASPPKTTLQYKETTSRSTAKFVQSTASPRRRLQPNPRPFIPQPAIVQTSPPSQRSSLRSNTPRPFAKVRPSSDSDSSILYNDYDDTDFYAEPVEIPLSGKVRIHNDGFIECLDIGNFPHPFSCRKFISCAKMENAHLLGWEYTCPKGLSFDPIGGICNWNAGLGCKE